MWQESSEEIKPLRSGLTTGSCATACCVAACRAIFTGQQTDLVDIILPRGKEVSLTITGYQALTPTGYQALTTEPAKSSGFRVQTTKDAGDDPDATHGATVFVELRLITQSQCEEAEDGIVFKAASGVGTVTKTGLLLDVGEPAINPTPRKMMRDHLIKAAQAYDYKGGFEVCVGVVDGEEIAKKTMNGRLGILGGLSILGTTGIVRPFSCAAYIASIRQGVDVASSNGLTHIAAATGSSSEAAIAAYYDLQEMALIEMGDFVGALLKHLKKGQVQKLTLCGGFGKMTKLAQGALDLNSRKCSIDFNFLHHCVKALLELKQDTSSEQLLNSVLSGNTSIDVLNMCESADLPLAAYICFLAQQQAQQIVAKEVSVEVFAINRKGVIIASSHDYVSLVAGQKV